MTRNRLSTTGEIGDAASRRRSPRTRLSGLIAMASALAVLASALVAAAPGAAASSPTAPPAGAAPAAATAAAAPSPSRATPSQAAAATTPPAAPLPVVSGLQVSGTTFTSVSLSWTLPALAEGRLEVTQIIVRRTQGHHAAVTPSEGTLVTRLGRNGVRVSDGGLKPGTTYSYAVFTSGAHGATSAVAAVTTTTLTTDRATGLSGHVTDSAGRPLAGVLVFLVGRRSGIERVTTNAQGRWVQTGLRPGQWTMCFIADGQHPTTATGFLPECYDNTPFVYEGAPPDPTWVTVRAGHLTGGIDAELAPGAALTGRVLDPDGTPVPGAVVDIQGGSNYFQGELHADTHGRFSVAGLSPGSYSVCYATDADTRGSSSTGYVRTCAPHPVRVIGSRVVTVPAMTLPRGGQFTGVVTSASGDPVAGVTVEVSSDDGGGYTTTGTDGRYAVKGLATGLYAVCFPTGSLPVLSAHPGGLVAMCDHHRAYDYVVSPDLPLVQGHTKTVDVRLAEGAALTGRVTDESGAPARDISISLDGDGRELAYTDADGRYVARGIPPGVHAVCFDDFFGSDYLGECYDNAPDAGSARPVRLRAGTVTTIDAVLSRGASISGTVTATGGAPIGGVSVQVSDTLDPSIYAFAQTDDSGHYLAAGLLPGTYRIDFDATYVFDGPTTGYASQTYDNSADGSATPVPVGAGAAVTADAVLSVGAAVEGTVTDDLGQPAADVSVQVSTGSSGRGVTTDGDGRYRVIGLPATDDATVCFYVYPTDPSSAPLSSECYDDVDLSGTPTPVHLTAGATTTIDASLAQSAAITGRVTDSRGQGIAYPQVTVTDAFGSSTYAFGDDTGHYVAPEAEGSYSVCFSSSNDQGPHGTGFIPECWDDVPYGSAPTQVDVSDGHVASGIDASLTDGAGLSGHVSNAEGAGVGDVAVFPTAPDGTYLDGGYTDGNGDYVLTGLPGGDEAAVCFYPYGLPYQNQCYDGQSPDGTPTPVPLTAGAFTTGIDALLAAG